MLWLSIEDGRLVFRRDGLAANQVVVRFALPGEVSPRALDQQLAGARTGIVIRGGHKTVSASGENCNQVARLESWKLAALGKKVPRFTNRADDVGSNQLAAQHLFNGDDLRDGRDRAQDG